MGQPQSPAQQVAAVEDPEDSPAAAVDQAVADAEVSNPEPVEEQSSQPIRYTVQRGDSLLVIAGRYGVTLLAVIEANNLTNPDFIYPGQELTIPMGDEAEPTIEEAVETAPQETEQAAVPAKFLWPVKNYRIVNYYWAWHPGIDLVVDVGTTVVASAAGEVEFSDWNNYGYGYVVIINHGGGVRTLYAHNSELLVAAGDRVKQGQKISLSGSTGMSNWPHVHLEIIFNDLYRVNPCDHLPGACRE